MDPFFSKTVLVTGGGSGIGRALGEELAKRGALLVLTDINQKRLDEVSRSIAHCGGNVTALQLDVSDGIAVTALINDLVREMGRLDYLFNNAGIAVGGEACDCSLADWTSVVGVNLYGVIHGVSAAYPLMVRQGFGHIINTASIEGLVPFPCTVGYVTSKYAVVGLSNALRIEGKDLGVKVSVVCPGFVDTSIFHDSKMINIDRRKVIESLSSFGGLTPQQCASVILRGVLKNKAIITVTFHARLLWMLHRLSPSLTMRLQERRMKKFREEFRTLSC